MSSSRYLLVPQTAKDVESKQVGWTTRVGAAHIDEGPATHHQETYVGL